jgi:hypothetical protein
VHYQRLLGVQAQEYGRTSPPRRPARTGDEPSFQKYKESIKDVYGLVLPMVVQELKEADSPFAPEIVEHLDDWLKNHTPAQLRIVPGMPPLKTTQVTKSSP